MGATGLGMAGSSDVPQRPSISEGWGLVDKHPSFLAIDLEYCLRIDSLDSHFLVALGQLLGCALPRTYCVTLSKLLTSLCLSFHICKMGP